MKKCQSCNISYEDDKKFCKSCGAKLSSVETVDSKIAARKAVLEEKLKADPLNFDLLLEYGEFLIGYNDFNKAELIIYRAIELNKTNMPAKKLLYKCLYLAKKNDEATELGLELLQNDPTNCQLLLDIATFLYNKNKHDDALQYLDQLIEIDPNNLDALKIKASILQKYKKHEDALKVWECIYKKDIENRLAILYIGIAEFKKQNYVRSKNLLFSILYEFDEQTHESFLCLVYYSSCLLHFDGKEKTIALDYKKILKPSKTQWLYNETKPLVANIALFLGEYYLNKKDFTSAKHLFENSMQFGNKKKGDEGLASTYLNMSILNYEIGDINNALVNIEKAISIVDINPEIHKKCLSHKELLLIKKNATRKKSKRIIISGIIIISIVISAIVIARFQMEKSKWNLATKENSIESYYNYLNQYPEGRYSDNAISLKEEVIWKMTLVENNPEAYNKYIVLYNNGKYWDEAYWKVVCDINTVRGFVSYISNSKSKKYLKEANSELEKRNYKIKYSVGRKNSSSIIIKNIRITENETIISLKSSKSGILHGYYHKYAYFIGDRQTGEQFEMKNASIHFEKSIPINKIFEVYFEKLPDTTNYIDLIEGECEKGCWNFYNIKIETAKFEKIYNSFSNKESLTFTDYRDGKIYKTVKIGNQIWMAENLAYLPSVNGSKSGSFKSYTSAYYYIYGYEGTDVSAAKATTNYQTYGVLYNWPAAKLACPTGWHLPTEYEWRQLEMAIGMSQSEADDTGWRGTNEGTKLKATSGWKIGNGTDDFGFSSLPGGYRSGSGKFSNVGYSGCWWSATEHSVTSAWERSLSYNSTEVTRSSSSAYYGFSVRCVRN